MSSIAALSSRASQLEHLEFIYRSRWAADGDTIVQQRNGELIDQRLHSGSSAGAVCGISVHRHGHVAEHGLSTCVSQYRANRWGFLISENFEGQNAAEPK